MHIFTTNLVNSLRNHQTAIIKKVLPLFLFSILYVGYGFANVYNVTNTADGLALNQLRGAILAADTAGYGPHKTKHILLSGNLKSQKESSGVFKK